MKEEEEGAAAAPTPAVPAATPTAAAAKEEVEPNKKSDGLGCRAWVWKGTWTKEMGASRSETINLINAEGATVLHFNPRVAHLVLNTQPGEGSFAKREWQREERISVAECGLVAGAEVDFRI